MLIKVYFTNPKISIPIKNKYKNQSNLYCLICFCDLEFHITPGEYTAGIIVH